MDIGTSGVKTIVRVPSRVTRSTRSIWVGVIRRVSVSLNLGDMTVVTLYCATGALPSPPGDGADDAPLGVIFANGPTSVYEFDGTGTRSVEVPPATWV